MKNIFNKLDPQKQQKIFFSISYILTIILGGTITCSFFYYRFIRERPAGPLDVTYTTLKLWLLIFSVISIYLWILYLFIWPLAYNIKLNELQQKYKQGTLKSEKNTKTLKIYYVYNFVMEQSRDTFAKFILRPLAHVFEKFLILDLMEAIMKLHSYFGRILLVFYFIPPAIIAFIFMIETIYYQKYMVFPYAIYLMVFPVAIRIILYVLIYLCESVEKETFSRIIDPVSKDIQGNILYIWHKDAEIYVSKEEQTPELLYIFIQNRYKYTKYLEILNDYKFHIFGSRNKRYLQIFAATCFFITAWGKIILLT